MSGIIGGAGAKSGVIGQTELDYEEGTWTPVPNSGSFNTVGYNWYRKIGGICFLQASIGNIQGGFGTMSGLPFATNPAGPSYESAAAGGLMFNGINLPTGSGNISPYVYNNAIYFYAAVDDGGWTHITDSMMENNDDIIMSASFFCIKT